MNSSNGFKPRMSVYERFKDRQLVVRLAISFVFLVTAVILLWPVFVLIWNNGATVFVLAVGAWYALNHPKSVSQARRIVTEQVHLIQADFLGFGVKDEPVDPRLEQMQRWIEHHPTAAPRIMKDSEYEALSARPLAEQLQAATTRIQDLNVRNMLLAQRIGIFETMYPALKAIPLSEENDQKAETQSDAALHGQMIHDAQQK